MSRLLSKSRRNPVSKNVIGNLRNLREKLAANKSAFNRNKAEAHAKATRNRNKADAEARARAVAAEWFSRSGASRLRSRRPRNHMREPIKFKRDQTLQQNPRGVANSYMLTHERFYELSPEDRQRYKAVLKKAGYSPRDINDNYPEV